MGVFERISRKISVMSLPARARVSAKVRARVHRRTQHVAAGAVAAVGPLVVVHGVLDEEDVLLRVDQRAHLARERLHVELLAQAGEHHERLHVLPVVAHREAPARAVRRRAQPAAAALVVHALELVRRHA
jgi:hypothetical protein